MELRILYSNLLLIYVMMIYIKFFVTHKNQQKMNTWKKLVRKLKYYVAIFKVLKPLKSIERKMTFK